MKDIKSIINRLEEIRDKEFHLDNDEILNAYCLNCDKVFKGDNISISEQTYDCFNKDHFIIEEDIVFIIDLLKYIVNS